MLEVDGAQLIVSAGYDRALRSWRLDGTAGALRVDGAHSGPIGALAVLKVDGAQRIVSAGADRAILSTRPAGMRATDSVRN